MRPRTWRHGCALLAGVAVALAASVFGLVRSLASLSVWGWFYTLALVLLAWGLVTLALQHRRARAVALAGAALLALVVSLRLLGVGQAAGVRLTTLPADTGPRVVARLISEQDGSLPVARLLELGRGLDDEEGSDFQAILRASYERMAGSSSTATPAIATYLGLQRPGAFDTIVIGEENERGVVIFLHGYAGNFLVYCWELAQAAGAAGLATVCPSVGPNGAWWSQEGERTFLETLRFVRGRGASRVYLAGLSNGAAGASVLALEHTQKLAGLILISGMRAQSPPEGLPTLVVQGSRDRMMTAGIARTYVRGSQAIYREISGGHLIFLSRHEQVRPIITEFLQAL